MSFLLALALQVAPASLPDLEVQRDIVVIGSKLKTWRARVRSKDGKMGCQTLTSTRDKDIDAIGCSAMAGCLTALRPRLIAAADRKLPAKTRKALNAAASRDLGACVMSRRDDMIADLAERRYQARQGSAQ